MMKNQKENDFRSKFRLLNSQETSEEIIWSYSDSSDYENSVQNETFNKVNTTVINRKRKRIKTRKKTIKNISNLDIVESPLKIDESKCETSPITQTNLRVPLSPLSPILTESQLHFVRVSNKNAIPSSPIIQVKSKNKVILNKSPILVQNHSSPKISPHVRKKLFENRNDVDNRSKSKETGIRSKSPVLPCSQIDKKLSHKSENINIKLNNNTIIRDKVTEFYSNCQESVTNNKQTLTESLNSKKYLCNKKGSNEESFNDSSQTETSVHLIEKVKTYFDSHFSSETPSQQSISEYDTTPKNSSKTSEEIEFITSQPDPKTALKVIKSENRSSSDSVRSFEQEFEDRKSKKTRYKKNGLAHRLCVLLKKQKANICLWKHERFLAANSKFIIPNEDFTPFRIKDVCFKYSCYLLKVMDVENKKYIVIINQLNANDSNFLGKVVIFKLYKPYEVLDYNNEYQLIANVTKFECTVLDK